MRSYLSQLTRKASHPPRKPASLGHDFNVISDGKQGYHKFGFVSYGVPWSDLERKLNNIRHGFSLFP
jgi:hypothetical protein